MSEKHEAQDLQDLDTKEQTVENGLMVVDDHYLELEKILVKKLDRRIIPIFFMMYFFASTDRGSIAQALIMNKAVGYDLQAITKMTPDQISLGVSLFYVGYVLFEVPSNLVMLKVNPAKWLARIMITWGIVNACMAAIKNETTYYVLRCLLGIMEAGLFPGMSYMLTKFYRKKEMAVRVGFYYFAAAFAGIVGNLTSAGLQTAISGTPATGIMNSMSLYPWQVLFLIMGTFTVLAGVVVLVYLPSDLESSKFLSPEELAVGLDRLNRETHVPHGLHFTWANLKAELLDYRVYLFAWLYLSVVVIATTLQSYGGVIVYMVGAGKFTTIQVSLVAAPISICSMAACLSFTYYADRFQSRTFPYIFSLFFGIAGFAIMSYSTDAYVRFVGVLLWGISTGPGVPLVISWLVSSKDGAASIAVSTALVSALAQVGAIFCTYYFYGTGTSEAPQYRRSNWIQTGIYISAMICALILRYDLSRQNKVIDRDGQTKSGRRVKYIL